MENLYNELDEAKAKVEKLKSECRSKGEVSENLKRAYNEQLSKFQDAQLRFEKQTQELNEKVGEAIEARQMCKELKCSLREKEAAINHLSAANEKLRKDCDSKSQTWDDEKRGLAIALEEANENIDDQKQKIRALEGEVSALKELLSDSKKKCLEVEKKAKAVRELKERDDILFNLEEEKGKIKDQLKWKKEQFIHLEEAHEKLRGEFKASKEEWEVEKGTLLDEIYSLQSCLDSQTRILEDLQNRAEMCNQALAHEESRRKVLEIQVFDFEIRYENVAAEYDTAKSQFECLNSQRNNEIASLRDYLGIKDTLYKELEYRARKLELENQDLLASIKELQEAGIQKAASSPSTAKLRNKLRSLEQAQKDCTATLKAKETEWSSQLEEMMAVVSQYRSDSEKKDWVLEELNIELENCYSSMMQLWLQKEENYVTSLVLRAGICEAQLELERNKGGMGKLSKLEEMVAVVRFDSEKKDRELEKLSIELENCYSSMMQLRLQDEENSVMSLVLRAGICEGQLELERNKVEMSELIKEHKDVISNLTIQLELKNSALVKAQMVLIEECKKSESLLKELDSYKLLRQKELEKYKELTEESTKYELYLKEKVLNIEIESEKKLRKLSDNLDIAHLELTGAVLEENEITFELWAWQSIAEQLKDELQENHEMRKDLEVSLLEQVDAGEIIKQEKDFLLNLLEDNDRRIQNLQQQIGLLEQELKEKDMSPSSAYANAVTLQNLQKDIECFELESLRREFEGAILTQLAAEITFELEKEKLAQVVHEKEKRIDELLQHQESMEVKFSKSLISFTVQVAETQAELNLVHEAWEKIAAAEIMAKLEIEEKQLMINELEENKNDIKQKLQLQEKSLYDSKQKATEVEAKLKTKELEMKELTTQMELKVKTTDALVQQFKNENTVLLQNVKYLSNENEKLLIFITESEENLGELSGEDMLLMEGLRRITQSFDNSAPGYVFKQDESVKENGNTHPSETKKSEYAAERSPFRELNYSSS